MISTSARLGIAVLARAPSDPGGKTRLREGRVLVSALQAAMLADTLAALSAFAAFASSGPASCTVFVAPGPGALEEVKRALPEGWTARSQRGATLGDRLNHAVEATLAKCDRVVVTGSDAPFVAEPLAGFGAFGADEVVLVPSDDGGYAAIALARREPSLFVDMPWSTDRVATETRARARAAGLAVRDLATTYDVDEPADLVRLRADLAHDPSRAPRTAAALGMLRE